MEPDDRKLVADFFAHARARAGSGRALAELLAPYVGGVKNRGTVDAWAQGRSNPPAHLLFTLAREFGISLDELLMTEEEEQTIREQLRELRGQMAIVKNELDRMRAVQALPPLEYPAEVIESA